ncbi:hypothetical protein D9756_010464 [Leucocoprinus leucothites]|uniref:Cation/H+ exchanger transmembrane domain-containing protein n=1 Tax=Leucocoprinus leucothites TaxID=201217 RepID=A0A8H5CUT6_9AGAR|nr:hypothetical protein D9756_010464 [Leucoagaricus leucothites]
MGPLCAGIFDPRSWATESNHITLEIMRVVLATGLFAIGVELPKSYMYDHMKGLFAMVVPTMAIGWVIVAGLLKALFTRFDFITCLVLAACLTPTDPIISAAIVGGKFARNHVPLNIRHLISAEAASNDGLAYPFLSISLYLTMEPNRRKDIQNWVVIGWLYQVFLGILIGAIIGYLFSHIMKFSHKRGFIDRESYVAQYLALAIFTMGVVDTLGSDDLLAAFAAGSAISWDGDFNTRVEGEAFATVIEYILNCGCFFYIGAWLPWSQFTLPEIGLSPWRLVVLCIGILLLRRIPAILALYRWVPEIENWKEALFCGHFGPVSWTFMGVGAIFISTLALHRLPEPQNPPQTQEDILAIALQPIVGFVVLVSIIVHGLSIPFFNVGRGIHSRTLTRTNTLGARTRTIGPLIPDWLLSVRRSPTDPSLPVHHSSTDESAPQLPPLVHVRDEKGYEMDPPTSHLGNMSVASTQPSTSLTQDLKVSRGHRISATVQECDYGVDENSQDHGSVSDSKTKIVEGVDNDEGEGVPAAATSDEVMKRAVAGKNTVRIAGAQ